MLNKFFSMITATLVLGTGLSVFTAASANAASIADNSTVSLVSMDASMRSCGNTGSDTAITSTTRVRSFTTGDNFDFSAVTTSSFVWDSTRQSEYNTILNRASTTRTTFSPRIGTTYTFYRLKEGSTSAKYFCHAGQVDLLINGTDAITGWVVSNYTFFTAGESSGSTSTTSFGAAELGPEAKSEQRQRLFAIDNAKSSLIKSFASGNLGTLESFNSAGIPVSSEAALARVNAKVLLLAPDKRTKIEEITQIVEIENFVDRISNSELRPTITTAQLVSKGFIAANDPMKISLTTALLNLNSASLDSVEKIKAAVVAETARLKERVNRTAAIKAKIAARNK